MPTLEDLKEYAARSRAPMTEFFALPPVLAERIQCSPPKFTAGLAFRERCSSQHQSILFEAGDPIVREETLWYRQMGRSSLARVIAT
jgi:hypothetical protein